MEDPKASDPTGQQRSTNLSRVWWLLLAAVVWGAILGVGALLHDVRRGLIVFAVLALFAAFWGVLLLKFQNRNSSKEVSEPESKD